MWRDFGIVQSLTMEASLGGCRHGPLKNLQFSSLHFQQIGRDVCATLARIEQKPALFEQTLAQLQFISEARRLREEQSSSSAAFDTFLASAPPGTIISESLLEMATLNKSGTDSDVSSSSDEDIVPTQMGRKKYKKRKGEKGKSKSKKAPEVIVALVPPPPLLSSMSTTLEARVANATQPSLRRNLFMQQGSDVPATRINSSKFVDRLRLTTDIAMSDPSASTKACLLAKADDSKNNTKPQQVFPSFTLPSAIRVVNFDIEFPNAEMDRARAFLATPYSSAMPMTGGANLRRPSDMPPRALPQRPHRSRQAATLVDLRGSGGEQLRTGTGRADQTSGSDFEADESANAFQ